MIYSQSLITLDGCKTSSDDPSGGNFAEVKGDIATDTFNIGGWGTVSCYGKVKCLWLNITSTGNGEVVTPKFYGGVDVNNQFTYP